MKKFPTIYRTKFKKGIDMFLDPVSHSPRNMGFYIEKGNFIASYKSEEGRRIAFNMEQGTIVVSSHMKKKHEKEFSSYGNEHYVNAVTKGWSIESNEDNSVIICFFYPNDDVETELSDEIFVPSYTKDTLNKLPKPFAKLPHDECLTLADVVQTVDEVEISFPKDYYLYIVKGPAVINGVEKTKKSWIVSSKDQSIKIKSPSDKEVIVFLSK